MTASKNRPGTRRRADRSRPATRGTLGQNDRFVRPPGELCVVHADGSISDAGLHAELLDDDELRAIARSDSRPRA